MTGIELRHGHPYIAGTNVPPRALLTLHRAGYDVPEMLAQYPQLTASQIADALAYESRPIRRLQRALCPRIDRLSENLADLAVRWR